MIDWSLPLQTKGGETALLLRRLENPIDPEFPMVVLVIAQDGEEVEAYREDGTYAVDHYPCGLDIINAPEKPKRAVESWYRGAA